MPGDRIVCINQSPLPAKAFNNKRRYQPFTIRSWSVWSIAHVHVACVGDCVHKSIKVRVPNRSSLSAWRHSSNIYRDNLQTAATFTFLSYTHEFLLIHQEFWRDFFRVHVSKSRWCLLRTCTTIATQRSNLHLWKAHSTIVATQNQRCYFHKKRKEKYIHALERPLGNAVQLLSQG